MGFYENGFRQNRGRSAPPTCYVTNYNVHVFPQVAQKSYEVLNSRLIEELSKFVELAHRLICGSVAQFLNLQKQFLRNALQVTSKTFVFCS